MRYRITWVEWDRPWWGLGMVRRRVECSATTGPCSVSEVVGACVQILGTPRTIAVGFRPEAS